MPLLYEFPSHRRACNHHIFKTNTCTNLGNQVLARYKQHNVSNKTVMCVGPYANVKCTCRHPLNLPRPVKYPMALVFTGWKYSNRTIKYLTLIWHAFRKACTCVLHMLWPLASSFHQPQNMLYGCMHHILTTPSMNSAQRFPPHHVTRFSKHATVYFIKLVQQDSSCCCIQ